MRITPDTKLGPYVVVDALGAGGMGEVYRARDARLGRDVAIKVLPASMAADRVALARFEREVRAVAALSHPNILAIFDTGEDSGVIYAVTELLEGETLRQRLKAGALPVRKALDYACQVAQGLAAAHEKGIVHRDLKPENIFLLPDGRVKILDFGLARQADTTLMVPDSETVVAATDPGYAPGTPGYMAPEQIRGESLSAQVDLFAFGAVLFEMLSGRRAFQARTTLDTLNAVLRDEPPDLTTLDPAIPMPIVHVVRRCLEKQPAERFQSARDLAFQLQVLAGTPTPSGAQVTIQTGDSPAVAGSAGASAPTASTHPVRRIVAWTTAAVFVAAAFAGGWSLRKPEPAGAVTFSRVTYSQQAVLRAAFAPEAGSFMYSAARSGNLPELFIRQATYPTSRAIGVLASHILAISTTGELALLTQVRMDGPYVPRGTLSRMPIATASPRAVLDDVRDAAWSPDGSELAVIRVVNGTDRLEYPPGRILHTGTGYLSGIRISPQGDRVAFVEHPVKWHARGSLVVVDRSGTRQVTAGEYPSVRGAVWRGDGEQIAFSARTDTTATAAIYAADLKGTVRLLLQSAGNLTLHDINATGQWLVTRDEHRIGLRSRARGDLAERELSWLDLSELASLADDGRNVLFTEFDAPGAPRGSVCLRAVDGSPLVTLAEGRALDLSPDGRLTLILRGTPDQLVVDPTGAGDDRLLPRGVLSDIRSASWFPDGRRILVCGSSKTESSRCYVQDTESGDPRPVTPDGERGVVSPDGGRVLVHRSGQPPAVYTIDGAQPSAIPGVSVEDVPARWTQDSAGLYVYRTSPGLARVDRIDLASGKRETVFTIAPADVAGLLAIEPVTFTPDLATYAYGYTRMVSTVFTVDGVSWK